jgi:hypothetical protein
MALTDYLKSGEHLPPELRDFHDAKLFFKWLVWEKVEGRRKQLDSADETHSNMMLEGLNLANAQIFTIDYFLWFMALFGYKLQRIRKSDLEFYDLRDAMAEYSEQLTQEQAAAFQQGSDQMKVSLVSQR